MGKYVEIEPGTKFGKLTVIERAPDRIVKRGYHRGQFHCLCNCGREVDVDASKLKNGHTRSCGCLHNGGQYGLIDRVGQVFGKLTVLERAEDHISEGGQRYAQWKCRCQCGRETTVRAIRLTTGHTKTCGYCLLNEKYQDRIFIKESGNKAIDLTGLTFGRLTVTGPADPHFTPSGYQRVCWFAACSCGNPKPVRVMANALLRGTTQSCGCLRKEINSEAHRKYNRYEFKDDYVIGFTEEGISFTVDLEDYEKIKPYYWGETRGYISTALSDGSSLRLHRLIMGLEKDDKRVVDHKNHDTHENRKWNLRIATGAENQRNIKMNKLNTSGIIGVSRKKNGRWYARITFNGKKYYLGTYDTKEEAAAARKAAEDKYFGEFSYANSMASASAEKAAREGGVAFCDATEEDAPVDITVAIDVLPDPVPEFDVLPPLPDLVPVP